MYNIKGLFEAKTLSEAALLLDLNPQFKIIAGGTDILIKLKKGLLDNVELLSLHKIKSLASIRKSADGTIGIGSMATFSRIYNDPIIKKDIPILSEAAISMGGPQIRNIATLGGNICNGATSADSASSLLTLNALLKLEGRQGRRLVPVREFYLGPGKVALRPGEILTEIIISPQDYQGFGGHYIKFAMRKAMDIATLAVAVVCKLRDSRFEEVRIGLGVAAPTPIRCLEAEAYAHGREISSATLQEIGKLAVKTTKARTSWRASKEYREHLVEELTQRALKTAIVRAGISGVTSAAGRQQMACSVPNEPGNALAGDQPLVFQLTGSSTHIKAVSARSADSCTDSAAGKSYPCEASVFVADAGQGFNKKISFSVNGKPLCLEVDIRESLLEVLRSRLGYTGAKKGCGVGECGACSVLIDGIPFDSCIYLAVWADGKQITTIEGIAAKNGELSDVQQAFIDEGAVQCGFCTPGLVLTTTALQESGKMYTRSELKRELSGHLCRCTGYQNILKAAEKSLGGHICRCKDNPPK